ncbi:MAG: hypothetical protein WAZ14_00865 [Patescibacteria group bacterium]
MQILPGVLAYTEAEFKQHLLFPDFRGVAPMFHIDVLDGTMFNAKCWAEAKVIGDWKNLPDIELHCMVEDPVAVADDWHLHVPTLKRVIFHAEIHSPLPTVIKRLRALPVEIVVAVNPLTPVDLLKGLEIDGLMIMGVEPGKSGQPFLGDAITAKVKRAKALFPQLTIAVDGGVTAQNIGSLKAAGADRCVASSAIWGDPHPLEAYHALHSRVD